MSHQNQGGCTGRATEAFEDLYFRVCTLDYGRMAEAMEPLTPTEQARIAGENAVDLYRLSI